MFLAAALCLCSCDEHVHLLMTTPRCVVLRCSSGIGFAKTLDGNLDLIKNLGHLRGSVLQVSMPGIVMYCKLKVAGMSSQQVTGCMLSALQRR